MKRTLMLKREALTQLSADELDGLAAGADAVTGASCPGPVCKLTLLHRYCPSRITCPTE